MKFWVNMDLGGMHCLTHYIHGNNITFFKIKQYYIKCPLKTPSLFFFHKNIIKLKALTISIRLFHLGFVVVVYHVTTVYLFKLFFSLWYVCILIGIFNWSGIKFGKWVSMDWCQHIKLLTWLALFSTQIVKFSQQLQVIYLCL